MEIELQKEQLKCTDFSMMTPSKEIFSPFDKETPQKLLIEDIVLDYHHGGNH